MYKTRSRFVQRLREKGWPIADSGALAAKPKTKATEGGGVVKKPPGVQCRICGTSMARTVAAIQFHFLKAHQKQLTEGEAFRIASPSKGKRRPFHPDGLPKHAREVSGGLPSLGKRR